MYFLIGMMYMKKTICICLAALLLLLSGCTAAQAPADIAATTLPVYQFTQALCQGTDLQVARLITESVSCLHDYSLQVSQMRAVESAKAVVISGAGLEGFLDDALNGAQTIIDASSGLSLLPGEEDGFDPHIWLSPANAEVMAQNICEGLCERFPQYADTFRANLPALLSQLGAVQEYGETQLSGLSCRELITFHDGFSYFADAFGLEILEAVEEESGSEASAADLIHLITLVEKNRLPAIFTEANGSTSAAQIISAETGAAVFTLDMAMAGDDYFTAMYHNIDTIREALQ